MSSSQDPSAPAHALGPADATLSETTRSPEGAATTQPEEESSLLGQVIGERYKVLEPIGRGGMGAVWKARHITLGSLVAVKVLLKPRSYTDRDDVLREAQLASKVLHPSIVHVMDFGLLADGRPYLVMEYLEGHTLGQVLKQR